ncbi:MAG: 2-dehydropantoate 2-reductase [Ectothiorhodospiraceae bacterium]|nr:2-dehydropantoate 2-reductase [Ectothiorhodospiraceae bacterium]
MQHARWPVIHLLGAGSLGLVIAAGIHRVAPLHLIRRPGHWPAVLDLELVGDDSALTCRLPQSGADQLSEPVTHLILCTKSYDALAALDALGQRLDPGAKLLLMQNGMGSQARVLQRFPQARISAATTTEGAYRTAPHRVVHAARGITRIGALNQSDFDWVSLFRQAGYQTEPVDDIRWHLADKLRVNALINPLTAIHRCLNGELLDRPALRQALEQLGAEADTLLEAEGFRFPTTAARQAAAVARSTARNRSSMLQDVTAGRRIEAADITGYLLDIAQRRGLPAPCHQALYARLRQLDSARKPDQTGSG